MAKCSATPEYGAKSCGIGARYVVKITVRSMAFTAKLWSCEAHRPHERFDRHGRVVTVEKARRDHKGRGGVGEPRPAPIPGTRKELAQAKRERRRARTLARTGGIS